MQGLACSYANFAMLDAGYLGFFVLARLLTFPSNIKPSYRENFIRRVMTSYYILFNVRITVIRLYYSKYCTLVAHSTPKTHENTVDLISFGFPIKHGTLCISAMVRTWEGEPDNTKFISSHHFKSRIFLTAKLNSNTHRFDRFPSSV